jgi:hypothetical protein
MCTCACDHQLECWCEACRHGKSARRCRYTSVHKLHNCSATAMERFRSTRGGLGTAELLYTGRALWHIRAQSMIRHLERRATTNDSAHSDQLA